MKIMSKSAIRIAVKTISDVISNHAGRAPSIVVQGYRWFADLMYSQEKKYPHHEVGVSICDPSGIRTRVTAVRGRRTRPLYDGAVATCQ